MWCQWRVAADLEGDLDAARPPPDPPCGEYVETYADGERVATDAIVGLVIAGSNERPCQTLNFATPAETLSGALSR